jgi:hypothetical protein
MKPQVKRLWLFLSLHCPDGYPSTLRPYPQPCRPEAWFACIPKPGAHTLRPSNAQLARQGGALMMTRIGLGILALAMTVFGAPAVAHAGAEVSILIYGPSLNGSPRNEQTVAERLGYSVTVADESTWSSYTTDDFASYDAIVFGDPSCGQKQLLATAEATRAVWSPAVTGNIMVIGMDPIYH